MAATRRDKVHYVPHPHPHREAGDAPRSGVPVNPLPTRSGVPTHPLATRTSVHPTKAPAGFESP